MTFSRGSDLWNIQLWAECLLGNGGHMVPQPFLVNPYTAFTWGRHWAVHRPFWDQVENLPMFTQWLEHILRIVCAIIYSYRGEPFLKHLELKICGWHIGRHSKNFHCRVWAKITILVPSYKSYDHVVTPRRASSSYRFHVHTFVMHALE